MRIQKSQTELLVSNKSCTSRLLCKKFYQLNNYKMKLFCFFLTLVLVNVAAADDYKTRLTKEIFLTNLAFEAAFEKNEIGESALEYLIEKMVDNDPSLSNNIENFYSCFARINYMIALPGNMEICNTIPASGELENAPPMIKGGHLQCIMRQEISKTLGIDCLEHDLNKDWTIVHTSDKQLEENRKICVKQAIENIMRRVLSKYEDSNFVPEVVLDRNGKQHDVTLYRLCRLMGINMSITFPTTYIREVEVDSNDKTCIFDDGTTKKLYNKINNTWSIINSNNVPEQPIEDQLEAHRNKEEMESHRNDDDKTCLWKEILLTNLAFEVAARINENGRNGLECVLEKMVDDAPTSVSELKNHYSCFAIINYMIALPVNMEFCNNIPASSLLRNTPPMIKGSHFQCIMRQEISKTLGIEALENHHIEDWGYNVLDTTDEELIQQRKSFVKPKIDNIIKRLLSKYADSNFVPVVVLDQNGTVVRDVTLYRLCRLMGINMSITFPATYIREVKVNPISQTCIFDDGTTKKLYNKSNDTWSIINSDNNSEQPIEDQIEALNLGSLSID